MKSIDNKTILQLKTGLQNQLDRQISWKIDNQLDRKIYWNIRKLLMTQITVPISYRIEQDMRI